MPKTLTANNAELALGFSVLMSRLILFATLLLCSISAATAKPTTPTGTWEVVAPDQAFDYSSVHQQSFTPLTESRQKWRLCTLYPHLKDSYWLNINYGMVDQAKTLGINLKVLVADGYTDSQNQSKQLEECRQWKADAVLVGSIGYDVMTSTINTFAQSTPVFGLVNNLEPKNITGKTGVSWYQMGYTIGQWLEEQHPPASKPVHAAWLSSPPGRGGSSVTEQGLMKALENSAVKIVTREYGDNDKAIKRQLIHKVLNQYPDLDYLIGDATMAEVAVSAMQQQGKNKPEIISTYLTHGVYRGLIRGKILTSNDDQPVLQGRLAIDQAVRYLEGEFWIKDLGSRIIRRSNEPISPEQQQYSLAPANYRPVYEVSAPSR